MTTICAVVGFGGLQMMLLGVTGEYLGRIYAETKGRPLFLLKESSEGPGVPVAGRLGTRHEAPGRLDGEFFGRPSPVADLELSR